METTNRYEGARERILRAHDSHQYLFFAVIDLYTFLDDRIAWENWAADDIDLWFEKLQTLADLGKELHERICSVDVTAPTQTER